MSAFVPAMEPVSVWTGEVCEGVTGAHCQRPRYTHPHPYMTANNQYEIFNGDCTGPG